MDKGSKECSNYAFKFQLSWTACKYCLIFASQKAVAHLEFECCIYSALTVMQILNEIPR